MDNQNQPNPQTPQPHYQQNIIIVGKQKSVGVAFILAFFFGPLGLLYASVTGGIVMFFVGLLISIVTLGFGLIFAWIGCIIWAVVAANNANSKAASGAGININVGTPPVQQNQPGQPTVQRQSIPEPLPQPTVVQQPRPVTDLPKVISETSQKKAINQPNTASLNSFSDWVTNNKKGLAFIAGGVVIILVLAVAIKYVVSLDFSRKNHTAAVVDSTKRADSAKMADSTRMANAVQTPVNNNLNGVDNTKVADSTKMADSTKIADSAKMAASNPVQTAANINNNATDQIYGVYPESSTRLLLPGELRLMDKYSLKIMRNEIFARHGYIFKTTEMKSYFATQSWYRPLYDNVDNQLSFIEKSNVEFIKSYEK